ncbi:MAG: SH3 domain-containing C40 family peptidase [Eubacteriales bacterium]
MKSNRCFTRCFSASALACSMLLTPALAVQGTVNSDENLRLRSLASTESSILALLSPNTVVDILNQGDEWYQVSYDDKVGYVFAEYLTVLQETPPVVEEIPETPVEEVQDTNEVETVETPESVETVEIPEEQPRNLGRIMDGPLNVRSGPSTESEIVTRVYAGNWVDVEESLDGWYRIENGFVSAEYVSLYTEAEAEELRGSSSSVVELAMTFLGQPYVYAGAKPGGFDCSGLTQYVYGQFGASLARTTSGQSVNGVFVEKSDLIPGDLLIFKKNGVINHVGIYIGNQQFIHASTPSTGVIISQLDSNYYIAAYHSARRIV